MEVLFCFCKFMGALSLKSLLGGDSFTRSPKLPLEPQTIVINQRAGATHSVQVQWRGLMVRPATLYSSASLLLVKNEKHMGVSAAVFSRSSRLARTHWLLKD
jgi:hypothetical protein